MSVICKAQNDPQALGSAITYARRYSLASILCIITEDDDGETAMVRSETVEPTRFIKAPYVRHNKSSLPDEKDWQSIISGITDADGLNRCKKQITSAKLEDATFKQVWGMLSAMSKQIGASYDKESKSFSQ